MEQARKNNRNIYTAFIDYKKAYDSVPHSWLIKILKIYKISLDLINFLSHVMTFWRTTLNLSINNNKLKSEPIQIKRGIYQGDSLSPLWFCLAINPLTNLLNSTGYGFNIRLNNTTLLISDIVKPNIPDTIANIKQKSLHERYFKELEQPEVNIQASHAWLKKSNIHPETEGFIFAIQDRVINTRNYKKHIYGLQSIIDKCRICGTEGETIEHIISSCTVLAQSEYKKRHDIFAKIIHMNLAVKFNLLKNTQPHYSYTPESCLENDSYKLYFDRTILTDIHIKHNRPDIIILNKQQKQAYLLDIAVPNSHNITQTYNTKINKYLELSVAMRNLWCLEKISIVPLVISAMGNSTAISF
jgi:hypothetical protein